ncbi:MAG: hypothetical protein JXR84_25355 [Anaerolineae bacterium]|nr:hypothetical protein [Anaerolineae bacterium]
MMKRWLIVCIGLLLLLLGCQAALPANAQTPPETADLRREIQLLNLINSLDLTPEQMQFILDQARQVQKGREALKAQADGDEMQATLEEIRDTLMAGESLSPELQERFRDARAENERLIKEHQEQVTGLAREVEDILEEDQLDVLAQYVPHVVPLPDVPRTGQAQAALERLRAIPADVFDLRKEAIARRTMQELEKRFRTRTAPRERDRELDRILELAERVRDLSDTEFELQQKALIEELLSPYEVARPSVRPMVVIARHLLDPAIIPLLEEKIANSGS